MSNVYGHEGQLLDDLRALTPEQRRLAGQALRWIEASPQPDGLAKREAVAYPGTGVIEAIYGELVIAYGIDEQGVFFLRVQARPDLLTED
jgi:hypothetical protein